MTGSVTLTGKEVKLVQEVKPLTREGSMPLSGSIPSMSLPLLGSKLDSKSLGVGSSGVDNPLAVGRRIKEDGQKEKNGAENVLRRKFLILEKKWSEKWSLNGY